MNKTTTPSSAWNDVQQAVRGPMQDLCTLGQELAGGNLLGFSVFGAALWPDFDPTRMPAASVMVLDRIDLAMLRRLSEEGARLGRKGLTAPLIMTPAYIDGSLDTFPLEFIEIHQRHVTPFGRDYFDDLHLSPEHVRLQCERELKRILIQMRQGLLAAGGRENAIEALAAELSPLLARILRGLLWLKGQKEALSRDAVVVACERLLGREFPGVRAAVSLAAAHDWGQFHALYHDVESLAMVADV